MQVKKAFEVFQVVTGPTENPEMGHSSVVIANCK